MPTYETLFITSPELNEADEATAIEALASVISAGGGTMVSNDRMGRRRLAYPIKKFNDGIYVRFLYDSGTDVPQEIERRMRLSDRVLRSLTVRLEPEWAEVAKVDAVREAAERVAALEREAVEARERAEAGEVAPVVDVPAAASQPDIVDDDSTDGEGEE